MPNTETTKITFENPDGQTIQINVTLNKDTDTLDATPIFDPPIDAKTNLGIMGKLFETFWISLTKSPDGN